MIKNLINDLENLYKNNDSIIIDSSRFYLLVYLIYLKHLCDNKTYEYEKIIYSTEVFDIVYMPRYVILDIEKKKIPVNSLIRNIINFNTKDLLNEFISIYQESINIYPIVDNKIVYDNINKQGISYPFNIISYDNSGNSTYVFEKTLDNSMCRTYKIFDKIFGINNKYKLLNEIDYEDYNYVCVFDDLEKYSYIKKDNIIYDYIYNTIKLNKKVILYSKYAKIGNFKDGREILSYLKTVILKDKDVVMFFEKEATEISIINYNNKKIKSFDILKKIIDNNRKQKDILIKTTHMEIRKNNMRIGFNLYQERKNEEIQDINTIVDENTKLLKQLNSYNETVEKEINKIFNM